jgi:hypothetical protein
MTPSKETRAMALNQNSSRMRWQFVGLTILMLGAFLQIHSMVAVPKFGDGYAEHIILLDQACSELRSAKMLDDSKPTNDAFPCSFTGYTYETQIAGLLTVDGISENIKGRCLTIAANVIDTRRSYVEKGYPRQTDMPAHVLANCKGKIP